MKLQNYIIAALLVFICIDVFAQDVATDYEALYRKELDRQDSLSRVLQELKIRQKQLVSITGSDSSKLTKKKDAKIKELESKKADCSKLLESPAYNKLQDLLNEQRQLESQIAGLTTDTLNLAASISSIDDQISRLRENIEELESIKANINKQLIDENTSILEKPFSILTLDELTGIKTRCSKYSSDQTINALLARTDSVLNNKQVYDEAIRIANSKYNKMDLNRIIQNLANIKGANPAQQSEISQIREILSHFEPGMSTFKEFIIQLNRNRDGVTSYSNDDLSDDLRRIFTKDNLIERINSEIIQVPYLERAYNDYVNAIKAKPMSHPEIETEILNYSN